MPDIVWIFLTVLALSVAGSTGLAGGTRWRWSWLVVLLAFAGSIPLAEQPKSAGLHWLGLAALVFSMGPLLLNPFLMHMRSEAWRLSTHGLIVLTAVFFAWYLLRLPSFGRVGFSSFMNHCMLLGPIAGLGVVIGMARSIHGRSWKWAAFAVSGLIPLLASGSRVAVLATMAGVCLLLFKRNPIVGVCVTLGASFLIYGFVSQGRSLESSKDSLMGAISKKGNLHSRAGLWEVRLSEFESSPIFGIGIAMGNDAKTTKDSSGNNRVEPGSSYLAVLAMTGAVGTAAFFCALGFVLIQLRSAGDLPDLELDILSSVGMFMAVHGVAEGWILAFGSPLCFLFWLWLGRAGDQAATRKKKPLNAVPVFDLVNVSVVARMPRNGCESGS